MYNKKDMYERIRSLFKFYTYHLLIIVEKLRIKFLQIFYPHKYFNNSYK